MIRKLEVSKTEWRTHWSNGNAIRNNSQIVLYAIVHNYLLNSKITIFGQRLVRVSAMKRNEKYQFRHFNFWKWNLILSMKSNWEPPFYIPKRLSNGYSFRCVALKIDRRIDIVTFPRYNVAVECRINQTSHQQLVGMLCKIDVHK